MNNTTHTIELAGGHQGRDPRTKEPNGERHTRVTFGHRLTCGDLMNIHDDPQSNVPTQHQLLLLRGAITRFGSLPVPVTLLQLLSLDIADIEDLVAANNEFLSMTQEGRAAEYISESEVRLPFGLEAEGIIYDRVKFGRRVTGLDMVQGEKLGFAELRRDAYLIGREIERLSTGDGAHHLDGPIELQTLEGLDGHDLTTLRTASLVWRDSFRKSGRGVQTDVGAQHPVAGPADGVE